MPHREFGNIWRQRYPTYCKRSVLATLFWNLDAATDEYFSHSPKKREWSSALTHLLPAWFSGVKCSSISRTV
ncbi:MAG: hypothetical protein KAT49_00990, partial [Methanomicrobia archaeon]|nr:hypothetical protein [Methanomicrobia archaeon]